MASSELALLAELPLGAFRAVEGDLGRLVVCEEGSPASLVVRHPKIAALSTPRHQCDGLGAHRAAVYNA